MGLEELTCNELRAMCEKLGLPKSGKKAELIARLEDGSAEAEKESFGALKDLTCDVLRAMCKEAGLPASGKKAELIARLEGDSAVEEKGPRMELEDLTCDVLRAMCDELGLPKSGKKAELIARLLEEGQDGGEPSGAKEKEEEETDSSALELLSYKDLQAMCKAAGIPANLKKAELIARLEEEAEAEGHAAAGKKKKKEPPAPAKPQGQKAGGGEGKQAAAATAAGGARPPTGGGAAVRTDGIRGLCLGASQNPNGDASSGKACDGCESRQYSPLNKIRADVESFASLLEKHFYAEVKTLVGREGSEHMTKNRFLGLVRFSVKRNLLEPAPPAGLHGRAPDFYTLYVLYYAGHGNEPDGHLCVEKGETVTLDDILAVWAASAPYKAGGSRLLIVADSCFAGLMAARLRTLCTRPGQQGVRQAEAARTVAVQASCGPDEVAYDGCFTSRYVTEIAKDHRVLTRHRLFQTTRFPVEEQRPDFYCPWGAAAIGTGPKGKVFPLYKA